jgi:hypothetical protein
VICDQNIFKPVPDCCDQHPACISCIRQYLNHGTHTNIAAIACVSHGCPFTFGDTQKLVQSVFVTKTQADEWWKMALTKTYIVNKVIIVFVCI